MKILVISPHPDDESIGCGGTLHQQSGSGDEIKVIFLTSGEQGGHGLDPLKTQFIREREAKSASRILGIQHIEFWREPDGKLKASRSLTDRLSSSVEQFNPARIFIPYIRDDHPDHRAAARLARAAVAQSSLSPSLLMFEVWTPFPDMDEVIDITTSLTVKNRAIRAYRSQCSVMRFDQAAQGLARFRGEMYCWPKDGGGEVGKYAEVFKYLSTSTQRH